MLHQRALRLLRLSEPITIPEENPLRARVDSTFTSKAHGISTGAIQAIQDLETRRIPVILASAQLYPILNILREYLGTSGAIVSENGGNEDNGGESRNSGTTRSAKKCTVS
jgi:hypothetical protein